MARDGEATEVAHGSGREEPAVAPSDSAPVAGNKEATISAGQQNTTPDEGRLLAQLAAQLAESRQADREAVRHEVTEVCTRVHSRKRKQLEDAAQQEREKLIKQHEAAMAEAVDMTARRQRDSQQFTFTVRGHTSPELSGSIPCSTFEAEPNSVLNKMYNGEWAYATDHQGRACVNSDPAHWPLILRWLSFGSIPAQPTDAFIDECKYWQLDNLLARIEQQHPDPAISVSDTNTTHTLDIRSISEDGLQGFQLKGKLHNFVHRFTTDKKVDTTFSAYGAVWGFKMYDSGAYLRLVSGPTATNPKIYIHFGSGKQQWCHTSGLAKRDFTSGSPGWGTKWSGGDIEKVQRWPYVDLRGSLHISVKLLFNNRETT